MGFRLILFIFLVSCVIKIAAQADSGKVTVIHADIWKFERFDGKEYQYLSHDVLVQHKQTYLLCDSAIILDNKVKAVGHVRIVEGDSLQIFGDTLYYDGDKLEADFTGKVVLRHRDRQLFTNRLRYDLRSRIASYSQSALLTSGSTHLTSKKGYYHAREEQAFFKDSVIVLLKDSMQLLADSLVYQAKKQIVVFTGPTAIRKGELKIYTEAGYYDTQKEQSEFRNNPQYTNGGQKADAEVIRYDTRNGVITLKNNAWIRDSLKEARGDSIYFNEITNWVYIIGNSMYKEGERTLKGDTIQFNRKTSSLLMTGRSEVLEGARTIISDRLDYQSVTDSGLATGRVEVRDTIANYSLFADTLIYHKQNQYFKALGHRPYLATILDQDSLYLAADQLSSEIRYYLTDSSRVLNADGNVLVWSHNLQAKCDSVFFESRDSTFHLLGDPVMWADTTQFSGDTVWLLLKNNSLDEITMRPKAFILNDSRDSLISQVKGREIIAVFNQKKLHQMFVTGNAESVYFLQDDTKEYIGTNYIQCSRMNLHFTPDQKVSHIDFYIKPSGQLLPVQDGKSKVLEGFRPRLNEKPISLKQIIQ